MKLSLFFVLSVAVFSVAQSTLAISSTRASGVITQVESIGFDEVCGTDRHGVTRCDRGAGAAEPTFVPDTVGILTHAFSNDFFNCGLDAEGAKCWKMIGSGTIDGQPYAQAVRNFLTITRPDSIKLSTRTACGILNSGVEIYCLVPDWDTVPKRFLKIKAKSKIKSIAVQFDTVCWIEEGLPDSTVECQHDSRIPHRVQLKIADAKDLILVGETVCARSKSEALCWSLGGVVTLPSNIVTAIKWQSANDGLCALTRDLTITCVDPLTGTILPTSLAHSIPTDYLVPYTKAIDFWSNDSTACVTETAGIVNCWTWWNGALEQATFSRPVREVFGSSYLQCALLDNGQAECRGGAIESITLNRGDHVRVEFGGYNRCFWNSSGVDCRGRYDNISYREVKDVSAAQDDDAICIVGVTSHSSTDFNAVQCFSYNSEINIPPFELRNPTAVATNSSQACALSDEGLTCWGVPFLETSAPPSVLEPRSLVMSTRHACVIDAFGLICWGELATLNLEIPAGLDQPGRVREIAIGTSRSCAILDTGDVQCWGRDYELSGPPPKLINATSIVGRGGLFCATDATGLHCWGGSSSLPH